MKNNSNLLYVSNATLSIVNTKITGTLGSYIYDYDGDSDKSSELQIIDSEITNNALNANYDYDSKNSQLKVTLAGTVVYKDNTRNGSSENLFVALNKTIVTANADGKKLNRDSEVWFSSTASEIEVFRGWNKDNVEKVNEGSQFENIFHYYQNLD